MWGKNHHQEDMVDRLAKIEFANVTCADCPETRPRWASFLKNKELPVEGNLCVMVCDDCAIRHYHVLGEKRCLLKCLECLHEWSHPEVDVVLKSGNALVNSLYEANLGEASDVDFDKEIQDDESTVEDKRRCKFIKNKYKRCQYLDEDALEVAVSRMQYIPSTVSKRSSRLTFSSEKTQKAKNTGKHYAIPSMLIQNNASYPTRRERRVVRVVGSMAAFSSSLSFKRHGSNRSVRSAPARSSPSQNEEGSDHHDWGTSSVSSLTHSVVDRDDNWSITFGEAEGSANMDMWWEIPAPTAQQH